MNETSGFLNSIGKIRASVACNKILINDFIAQPVVTIKQNNIDFLIRKGEQQILFSDYLASVSASARDVIIQSVIGINQQKDIRNDDGLNEIGDDDGWIDEVGGAATALAVAVANALALANAIAMANVNALANANIMANVNGWGGAGGQSASSYHQVDSELSTQIMFQETALSLSLKTILEQRGLNVYRRATLIKHLAEKSLRANALHRAQSAIFTAEYKGLNITLTLSYSPEGYQIIHADLLH